MSSVSDEGKPPASVTGAVSPRPLAIVTQEKTLFKVEGADPFQDSELEEINGLDLAYLSAEECEREWGPGFFHEKDKPNIEAIRLTSKIPTVVLSTGRYKYDSKGVPVMGAKLNCAHCGFFAIYDGWAQMCANIPEQCGQNNKAKTAPDPNPECPMFKGRLRAQYEGRQ